MHACCWYGSPAPPQQARRRRRIFFRTVRTRGAIANEGGPTRRRATPALNQSADDIIPSPRPPCASLPCPCHGSMPLPLMPACHALATHARRQRVPAHHRLPPLGLGVLVGSVKGCSERGGYGVPGCRECWGTMLRWGWVHGERTHHRADAQDQ
jgi:hypothetical protein